MAVTNEQIMDELQTLRDKALSEIKEKLDKINGRQRETEKVQAGLVQSRHHQETVAGEMKGEIKTLRGRTNIVATALALGQLGLAALFGNKQ